MTSVRVFEHGRPVHEAVRPVEQGVVNDQAKEEAQRQVVQGILERVPVNARHSRLVHLEEARSHDGEDQYRLQR